MTTQGREVRHHRFEDLRRSRQEQTAAVTVPLLMWRDAIPDAGPEGTDTANFHSDFFSLYVVRRGRGIHVIDGVPYGVARGDVYAMGPGMVHHFVDCRDLLLDTLHFSPAVFDAATLDALAETSGFHDLFVTREARPGANRWLHLTPAAYEEITGLVAELHTEWASGTPDGTLLVSGLFLRLLVRLSRRRAAVTATSTDSAVAVFVGSAHEATVADAVRFMDENFADPLRVEQIAARAFLSPHRFTEVFSAVMGRTPRDYLRHLRVERAKALLASGDATIAEVAERVGLGDAAYMTRVLREATGLTPAAYRRRMRGTLPVGPA
jgi:AraC-like DNA-binding protein/mannose-6-phosphate isomerase-like protein (cupin superfamily)